jgi:LPS export ABC transporter protein LptC
MATYLQVLHVKLLRRFLIGLIALVAIAVLTDYVWTWRRRRDIVRPAAQILSADLMRSVDNVEYFANESGGVKFELHARKLLETRKGKQLLEGVDAHDFNSDGSERNHISSQKAEYDPKQKQVYFFGDVQLRFGADIGLRMDSLHYNLDDQTGWSDDHLNLFSSQASGTAGSVRYDNLHRRMELSHGLAFDLHRSVSVKNGAAQVENYKLSSQHGYYSEADRMVRLTGAAHLASATGTLTGDRIAVTFTPDKRHVASLLCEGNGVYESADKSEVCTLQGERIEFGIGEASHALESIRVREHAGFLQKSDSAEQRLNASEITMRLDPVTGLPQVMQSLSGVRFELMHGTQSTVVFGDWLEAVFTPGESTLESIHVRDHAGVTMGGEAATAEDLRAEDIRVLFRNMEGRSVPKELQAERSVQWRSPGSGAPGRPAAEAGRSLSASSLKILYSETGDSLESGTATGGVTLAALPASRAESDQVQKLQCDAAVLEFYPGNNHLRSLSGEGHVQVFYSRPGQRGMAVPVEGFRTSSSRIVALFKEADGSAEAIHQSGDFVYQDATRTATAGNCDYTAATERMVLTDHPKIADSDSSTTGEVVEYDRSEKIITVRRSVRSLVKSTGEKSQGLLTSASNSSSPSIVTADEMQYWTDQSRVRYSGGVRLLSSSSQLQAQSMVILNSGDAVEAEGDVLHLVQGVGNASEQRPSKQDRSQVKMMDDKPGVQNQVTIHSSRLRYARSENRVRYTGDVFLVSATTKIWADSMDVFLDQAGVKVERATAQGNLRVRLSDKEVKGAEGEYLSGAGTLIVTGSPAEVYDYVRKSTSTALRLTLSTSDGRILLENR